MRRIIVILILLFSARAFAQSPEVIYGDYIYPGSVYFQKGLYIPIRDTTGFVPTRVGALVIRPQDTVGHPAGPPVRMWNGNYWGTIGGGAGSIYFANNGIHLSGNTFQLGDSLLQTTNIKTKGFGFSLNAGSRSAPIFNLSASNQQLGYSEADSTYSGYSYAPNGKQGVFRFYAKGIQVGILTQGSLNLNDSLLNNYLSAGKDYFNLTGSNGAAYAQFTPGGAIISSASGSPYATLGSIYTFPNISNADTIRYLTTDVTGKLILRTPSSLKVVDSVIYQATTGIFSFRFKDGSFLGVPTGLVDSLKKRIDSLWLSNDTLVSRRTNGNISVKITGIPQANITGLTSALAGKWSLSGNTAIGSSFIGSTDSTILTVKTNNQTRMTFLPNGNTGLGTTTPNFFFQVNGTTSIQDFLNINGVSPFISFNNSGATIRGILNDLLNVPAAGRFFKILNGLSGWEEMAIDSNKATFNVAIDGTAPPTGAVGREVPTAAWVRARLNDSLSQYTLQKVTGLGATTTVPLTLSGRNTLLGVTPMAIGNSATDFPGIGFNVRFMTAASTYQYASTNFSSYVKFVSGGFSFFTAPSGTSGTNITFTETLTGLQNGNWGVGVSPGARLDVRGSSSSTGNAFQVSNSTPTSLFEVANNNSVSLKGGVTYNINNQNGNYTIAATDFTIWTSSSGITYTLPAPFAIGRMILIKNTSAGNITITMSGGATVDGSSSNITLAAGAATTLQGASATNWLKITP